MKKEHSDFLKMLEVEFSEKEDLSKKSFIGIGGVYDTVAPSNESELVGLLEALLELGIRFKIIGKLSNTIIVDKSIEIIVKTDKMRGYSVADNEVTALCGEGFASLSERLARVDISLEPRLSGIPGAVGGMIYNNAGAYGAEFSDIFLSAIVYDFHDRALKTLAKDEMEFSYRKSLLSRGGMALVSAKLLTEKSSFSEIRRKKSECMNRRMSTQPISARTLGSVFKRYGDIAPARLIDELGLKGCSVGGAVISEKHAGFIENRGGATADDVRCLINIVKHRVFDKYGIALEEEIEIV